MNGRSENTELLWLSDAANFKQYIQKCFNNLNCYPHMTFISSTQRLNYWLQAFTSMLLCKSGLVRCAKRSQHDQYVSCCSELTKKTTRRSGLELHFGCPKSEIPIIKTPMSLVTLTGNVHEMHSYELSTSISCSFPGAQRSQERERGRERERERERKREKEKRGNNNGTKQARQYKTNTPRPANI